MSLPDINTTCLSRQLIILSLPPEETSVPLRTLVDGTVMIPAIASFTAFGMMLAALTTMASAFPVVVDLCESDDELTLASALKPDPLSNVNKKLAASGQKRGAPALPVPTFPNENDCDHHLCEEVKEEL